MSKEIIEITDKSKIKKITFKYPEIMASNAEEEIKKEYYNILALRQSLQEERIKVRELEESLKEREKSFKDKSTLLDIEFETSDKSVTLHKCNIGIRGAGNDLLGSKSYI